MASSFSRMAFQVSCSSMDGRPSTPKSYDQIIKNAFSSALKPWLRLQQVLDMRSDVPKNIIKNSICTNLLDAFVDLAFEFVDQPLLPSQENFAPVKELGEPVVITHIEGKIPESFHGGVYIRNGANPLFGALKSTKSIFGKSSRIWVEGEGMLHALYFTKDKNDNWSVHYNNRYVETQTFNLEKQRNKPSFLPIIEGDSTALIAASLLNLLRFGKVDKYMSNTNVFEHSGKLYSVAENHVPQEIDISTLQTLGDWDLSNHWNRPFASHPKKAPGTGELVIIGMNAIKPYVELGVISADGKKIVHKTDLKLDRCTFCHDFGVTKRYNVFMDFPLTLDAMRFFCGGSLIKFDKNEYARIGVMPRYGNSDSIIWFDVEPNCTFHLFNCFEDGEDEVVVWGCRTLESVIATGSNKENFDTSISDGLLYDRPYEWRLNLRTKQVKERNLTSNTEFSMDFPTINPNFYGVRNRFGYAQVVDSPASFAADNNAKFGGLAKLHFEPENDSRFSSTKVEYKMFEKNTFGSGATFIPKIGSDEEDDGWIITFVHNEDTDISQALVIDTKKFSGDPVAKITLPSRVPYGFHGAFIPS
ncbi:carotenoid 9,10(9',10')-cleavage dioxygenase 1-like isoform X1 [Cannabis sativa]|uniref:Uncharacterized protein n=1 Tax=Cannabis sativa TaxID=3483 RepID=A0A7J6HHG4_CANSA|nr:carotenoid 9,10(9',10')-cleavage dioxygenase 1-like isoform X1 [Cannabis sativa]KAF4394391.1 hypothetical protein G4B88_018541 [Cannabis sativa]